MMNFTVWFKLRSIDEKQQCLHVLSAAYNNILFIVYMTSKLRVQIMYNQRPVTLLSDHLRISITSFR